MTAYRERLSEEEKQRYQAYYCGLCKTLKDKFGMKSQLILTYDCTFLAMVLDGVYENEECGKNTFCFHKAGKVSALRTDALCYSADMNILLSYQNYRDKAFDEKTGGAKRLASVAASRLRKDYQKTAAQYPRQAKAVERYLDELQKYELSPDDNVEYAANLTGEMLREIFVVKEDEFSKYLGEMGFYLGKFIYLADAYEDVERDNSNGSYNPFSKLFGTPGFEDAARMITEEAASRAAGAFEMMPIFRNREILRNILYSGMWLGYAKAGAARKKQKEEKSEKN